MECGWASPETLDNMYDDDFDHHGIYWWSKYIQKQNESIKSTK